MKRMVRHLALVCLLTAASNLATAGGIETRSLHFAKGTSSVTVHETLKGDTTIDYKVGARTGQTMSVILETSNNANYFNVLPPGSKDVAIFIGSTSGNEWSGLLPDNGEYTIRVYLMRSAARRNETASYTLSVDITGDTSEPTMGMAPAGDVKVKDTPYHATGQVTCTMGDSSQDFVQCEFGVIRGTPGNAEVHLTPPGGFKRVLIFAGSKVSGDSNAKVMAKKEGDTWSVDVNDYEHYRIPEAVITGG